MIEPVHSSVWHLSYHDITDTGKKLSDIVREDHTLCLGRNQHFEHHVARLASCLEMAFSLL